jgi:hypothetical protein
MRSSASRLNRPSLADLEAAPAEGTGVTVCPNATPPGTAKAIPQILKNLSKFMFVPHLKK